MDTPIQHFWGFQHCSSEMCGAQGAATYVVIMIYFPRKVGKKDFQRLVDILSSRRLAGKFEIWPD